MKNKIAPVEGEIYLYAFLEDKLGSSFVISSNKHKEDSLMFFLFV